MNCNGPPFSITCVFVNHSLVSDRTRHLTASIKPVPLLPKMILQHPKKYRARIGNLNKFLWISFFIFFLVQNRDLKFIFSWGDDIFGFHNVSLAIYPTVSKCFVDSSSLHFMVFNRQVLVRTKNKHTFRLPSSYLLPRRRSCYPILRFRSTWHVRPQRREKTNDIPVKAAARFTYALHVAMPVGSFRRKQWEKGLRRGAPVFVFNRLLGCTVSLDCVISFEPIVCIASYCRSIELTPTKSRSVNLKWFDVTEFH